MTLSPSSDIVPLVIDTDKIIVHTVLNELVVNIINKFNEIAISCPDVENVAKSENFSFAGQELDLKTLVLSDCIEFLEIKAEENESFSNRFALTQVKNDTNL